MKTQANRPIFRKDYTLLDGLLQFHHAPDDVIFDILTLNNPNRARILIFSFCNGNPAQFHAPGGGGYAFWVKQVIALNRISPQTTARLVRSLDHWKKYQPQLKAKMKAALRHAAKVKGLSKDVRELITKAL